MKKQYLLLLLMCFVKLQMAYAQTPSFIKFEAQENLFELNSAVINIHSREDAGVLRAARDLCKDFEKVTGKMPSLQIIESDSIPQGSITIISPTSPWYKKTDPTLLKSLDKCNEKHIIRIQNGQIQIMGSDKRGTIYGIYTLSEQIGVSPWYYWADVPTVHHDKIYLKNGDYTAGEPAVTYRGIFLNDEWPCLGNWTHEKFGGFNHEFYEKVFELVLRLKGNFMWPAMWASAFYDDDPQNGPLANEMGIVMGTSHHEPMALAQQDWKRRGSGAWNYQTNANVLDEFWRKGVERAKDWETVITVGMRGDGDEPMSEESNISLLTKIVKNQRKIIASVTGKKAQATPQVWALYKEVQDYYDHGMRVPDDVTLMLCDDNWGNVRKLPDLNAKPRSGGYGMYYHVDYVGGPRNYKWMNVSQIQRIWEQMNLTYCYGVNKIWILNVGDLKPMEYPITFFLDMAWNPNQFNAQNLLEHTEKFCAQQFGETYAKDAARLINLYTKYNHRCTPELLNQHTYSLHNYNEYQRVVNDYKNLELDAMRLYYELPENTRAAFDQLVLFPITACANLYEMYYSVAMNHDLAAVEDPQANYWAQKVKDCYERDSLLTIHYHQISDGKWNHLMEQTHIGYTYWQQPEKNKMPDLKYIAEKIKSVIFVEADSCISIEAEHYTRCKNDMEASWTIIPDLGKTLSSITTLPATHTPSNEMYLEYDVDLSSTGTALLSLCFAPTLNFNGNKGLRYAVSVDGGQEIIVNINEKYNGRQMEMWQANSANWSQTSHLIAFPGHHTLRYRALDSGLVLQKIMLQFGSFKPSFLGAPESATIELKDEEY